MNLQNLTKKNQEFIHIATNQLIHDGKTDSEIKTILEEILPTILENQKKGVTARSLYGAPTVWAASFTEKNSSDSKEKKGEKNTNPWLMWLDTSLLFIGLVSCFTAILAFFNSSSVSATNSGLLSILCLGFGGGAAMYVTYYYIYRHMGKDRSQRPPLWKSIILIGLVMIAWILLFSATAFLPKAINPQLPALALLVLGGAALLGRFFLQKKYNILNALSAQANR